VELSAREQEVLLLLDSELTLGQMAQKLFISPNTLKAHTRSIYRKLGVTSRLSAVRAVRERIYPFGVMLRTSGVGRIGAFQPEWSSPMPVKALGVIGILLGA